MSRPTSARGRRPYHIRFLRIVRGRRYGRGLPTLTVGVARPDSRRRCVCRRPSETRALRQSVRCVNQNRCELLVVRRAPKAQRGSNGCRARSSRRCPCSGQDRTSQTMSVRASKSFRRNCSLARVTTMSLIPAVSTPIRASAYYTSVHNIRGNRACVAEIGRTEDGKLESDNSPARSTRSPECERSRR